MFGFPSSSAQRQWLINYILAVKKASQLCVASEWLMSSSSLGFKCQEERNRYKKCVFILSATSQNFDTGVSEAKLILWAFAGIDFGSAGLKRWHSGLYARDFDLVCFWIPPSHRLTLISGSSKRKWCEKNQSALCRFGLYPQPPMTVPDPTGDSDSNYQDDIGARFKCGCKINAHWQHLENDHWVDSETDWKEKLEVRPRLTYKIALFLKLESSVFLKYGLRDLRWHVFSSGYVAFWNKTPQLSSCSHVL